MNHSSSIHLSNRSPTYAISVADPARYATTITHNCQGTLRLGRTEVQRSANTTVAPKRHGGYSRILSVVQSHSALLFRPGIVALGLGIGVGKGTGVAEGKASPDEEAADCLFQSGGVRPSGDAEATAAAPATRRRAELRMSESEN
jgi:hypothetical protein